MRSTAETIWMLSADIDECHARLDEIDRERDELGYLDDPALDDETDELLDAIDECRRLISNLRESQTQFA